MKKLLLLASCFAVVLVLSNLSVAQEAPAAPCTCCVATPSITLPLNHPGLSVDPREIRRTVRLESRIAIRQLRIEQRHAVPQLQGYPYLPGPGFAGEAAGFGDATFAPADSYALPGGPIFQTGRWNSNTQRVTANNAPVINFLSLVRGPQPVYPPYYAPAQ